MIMNELRAPKGAVKKKRIIGRGQGCTKGGTSGRGHKGQNARSGGGVKPGFEGGQMPLYRRIAWRGFSNYPFKKEYVGINLDVIETHYEEGETVSEETLKAKGLLKGKGRSPKVLGRGEISKKLTFEVEKVSASAAAKIDAAGGKIVTEEGQNG